MQSLVAIQKADGAAGARENAAAAKRPPPPPPQEEAKRDDPFSLRPPVARKPGAVKTWRGEDLDAAVAARLRQQVQLQTAASTTPHALASPANQPPLDATSRRDSMPSSLATWSPPRRMKPLRRQRRAPPQAPPLLPPLRFPWIAAEDIPEVLASIAEKEASLVRAKMVASWDLRLGAKYPTRLVLPCGKKATPQDIKAAAAEYSRSGLTPSGWALAGVSEIARDQKHEG